MRNFFLFFVVIIVIFGSVHCFALEEKDDVSKNSLTNSSFKYSLTQVIDMATSNNALFVSL